MKPVRLSLALLGALAIPTAAQAQRVIADISIHQGPVTGRVIVGHPPIYREREIVEVDTRYWHPVRVYRVSRGHDWYRGRGYHAVRIWYDPYREFYYDRYHRGLREIVVYERGGRYYRDDSRNNDSSHRDHGDHDRSDWRDDDGSRRDNGDHHGY